LALSEAFSLHVCHETAIEGACGGCGYKHSAKRMLYKQDGDQHAINALVEVGSSERHA
jgi:hypothetical protein